MYTMSPEASPPVPRRPGRPRMSEAGQVAVNDEDVSSLSILTYYKLIKSPPRGDLG